MLELNNIHFSYDKNTPVLSGLNLKVEQGDFLALIGPNGSGKTTLIKLICDLLKKQKGTIKLNGTDTHDLNAKKEILYLPSDDILPEFLTGREYIKLMLKMYSAVMDERKLSQLAKYYDFESALDVLIEEYSNGMKKNIQLIVSMLISPKVLIIDETLNGMDVESTEITKLLLSNFIRPEKIVIMCFHDLHLLEEVCNKVVILYGVKIHTKENIKNIQKTTSLLSVYKKIINHDELKEAINKFQDNDEKYHEIKTN